MSQLLAQAGGLQTSIEQEVDVLNFFQKDVGVYITRLVELAMIGGAIVLLIYLIWGGIDWIMSEGDKTKYETARNKITHALLGMAILACVWAIWSVANYFLGIDKVFTRGGGARSVSTTTGTTNQDFWPFGSRSEWEAAFEAEHGHWPSSEDEATFHKSQPYAREQNRPLTPADWEYYYEHGHWRE